MITYDYTIERKVGEGKLQRFVPGLIPTTLGHLISIEGPNSSGKSTLLNIIALGLFGTKSPRINPILQNKLNSLLDSNHQRIKFRFEIDSANGNLKLRADKNSFDGRDIVVTESIDGKTYKPLSYESFERKYNLIYDIPNNPTERLSELLKELKEDQAQYGNKFKEFGFYLRKTITQITASRDPKRLAYVKAQLKEKRTERSRVIEDLPKQQDFLNLLEKSAYLRYYYYYLSECQRLSQEKERVEETIRKFGANGKRITLKLKQAKTRLATLQNEFRQAYSEVTPLIDGALPKSERQRFKIWKEINAFQPDNDDLNNTKIEALHFSELFSKRLDEIQQQSSFKDASLVEKILNFLEQYEHSGLFLTKLSVTLGDFIKILKEEYEKSSIIVEQHKTLSAIVEMLTVLVANIDQIKPTLKEIEQESIAGEKLSEKATETYYGERAELGNIERELRNTQAKCDAYFQRCVSIGFDENALSKPYATHIESMPHNEKLEQYLSLSENETMVRIGEMKQSIVNKNSELTALNIFIANYEKEEQNLEKQKPHKYEVHNDLLIELLKKIDALSQKLLNEYNAYLKNLIDKKVKEDEIKGNRGKERYYDEISKYLAHRIGFFRHIDTTYRAKVVNLISGVIVTEDDCTIYIADMGTGQSQSAYLLSLLNVKNDDRRVIALFDEIAMMDESSMEPICNKLKKLHKENKLLLGILVQKGNTISIKQIE